MTFLPEEPESPNDMKKHENHPEVAAFDNSGTVFSVHDPRFLERADFDLWNDRFCVTGTHTGTVDGRVFTPNAQPYAESPRPVYCLERSDRAFWSLSWGPVFRDPAVFSFDIHQDHLSWLQETDGVTSDLSVAVPREAGLEAWRLRIGNHGNGSRELVVIPAFPTGLLGLLSHESELAESPFGILHHYFPYYVKIPDYGKMARRWNTTFFFVDRTPQSWTALERDFTGFEGWANPAALRVDKLGSSHCHYERGCCAVRYEISLEPGEVFELGWIFGPARDPEHAREIATAYPPREAFSRALDEQRAFRRAWQIPLKVNSPDKPLDHYMNHWSPDRSIRIGRTYRFNPSPQARNAIQDTMTLALFDPETARERFKAIWRHQQADGFMPHGLPMVPDAEIMPITLIPHKDTNVWGPIALDVYLRETNDLQFLDEEIPFKDGGKTSLAGHLETGLRWLLEDRSERGLSHIGQGDWNDPLNMAGPEGRGESIWLTEALAYSLDLWAQTRERRGLDGEEWRQNARACREAVNEHAWDGNWYIRAVSDDGTPIGSKENAEGALFLNTQSWAVMAGIADEDRVEKIITSVNEHLGNRIAPAVLGPPYSGMAEHVGKLTLKSPGTGENGSIYSHAALFWSYALFRCGRTDEGWRVLRNLLPGTADNSIESAGQVPLYIPNFYRGPASPGVFGRSSHSPNTGSAAWVYLTFLEEVIGLKGNGDHLIVNPRLPADWDQVSGERVFRGTRYAFSIKREEGSGGMRIKLDGEEVSERIPWEAGPEKRILEISLAAR